MHKFTQDRTSHGNIKASRARRDGGAKSVTLFRLLEELTRLWNFTVNFGGKNGTFPLFQSHSLHHVGGGCWLAPWVSTGLDSPLREMQTFSLCLPLTAQGSFWEMPGPGHFCLHLGEVLRSRDDYKFAPVFRAQWGIRSCQAGVPSFPPGSSVSFQPRCPSSLLQ